MTGCLCYINKYSVLLYIHKIDKRLFECCYFLSIVMKIKPLLASTLTAIGLSMALAMPTTAFAQTCKVTDPTGTPLNARATPNGKVIGQVKNGTTVYVSEYDYDDKGRPWVLVFHARTDRYIGWVFREFISCY